MRKEWFNGFTPLDNPIYRHKYEAEGKGSCGVAVVAIILQKSCREVLEIWNSYKGFAPTKDIRRILKGFGYTLKQRNGKKSCDGKVFTDWFPLIVRIQWLSDGKGPYHTYDSWVEASCNTHLILVDGNYFYCNSEGWIPMKILPAYLKINNGYITSFYEVMKNGC